MSEPSLLVTRFTIPPVRVRLLPCEGLIERLNQICALPLVPLSTGAGFGKTTLLAAWARLQLEVGNLPAVERWSHSKDRFFGFPMREQDQALPSVFQEEEALLVVRFFLAQEKAEEALQNLAPWKEQAQAQGRMHALHRSPRSW